MPLPIPVYDQQLSTPGLPGVRQNVSVTADDYGAGAAKAAGYAAGQVIDTASALYQNALAEQKNARLMDAYARLGEGEQGLRETLKSYKGKAVLPRNDAHTGVATAPGETLLRNFDALAKSIRAEIRDPEMAAQVDKQIAGRRLAFSEAVDMHVATESDAAALGTFEAAKKVAAQDAAEAAGTTWSDIGGVDWRNMAIGKAAETARQLVAAYGSTRGWSPEQLQAETLEATTTVHAAALEQFLAAEDATGAQEHLAAHRAEIDSAHLAKFEKLAGAAEKRAAATRLAQAVLGQAGGDPDAALQMVAERTDLSPDIREDAGATVVRMARAQESALNLRDAEPMGRLGQQLGQDGTFSLTDPDYLGLSDRNKGIMAERRKNHHDRAERKARGDDSETRTDRLLRARFSALDPSERAALDEETAVAQHPVFGAASEEARWRMVASGKKTKATLGADQGTLKAFVTARLATDPTYQSSKKRSAQFRALMFDRWERWKVNHPDAAPTEGDLDQLLADAMLEAKRANRPWWSHFFGDDDPTPAPRAGAPGAPVESVTPAKPAPTDRVVIRRGSDGKSGVVTRAEAEAWIAKNPDWSIVP